MEYPYIGKSPQGDRYLVVREELIYNLISKSWLLEAGGFAELENITREYLANTYGEVESKEHAELIIKLAKSAGFEVSIYSESKSYFAFVDGALLFIDVPIYDKHNRKLITIPLPPKEHEEDSTKQLERKLSAAMSTLEQLGYTYHGGELWKPPIAEAIKEPEPKEWPQVGDEVLTTSKQPAVILAINSSEAWVRYSKRNPEENALHSYNTVAIATLSKPLTPEEELESQIKSMIEFTNYNPTAIAQYIINGEIKGLSYKPK